VLVDLPVVRTLVVITRDPAVARQLSGGLTDDRDESSQPRRVLATGPGRRLDTARHVDTPRAHATDRVGDVVGGESAREQQTDTRRYPFGLRPVEGSPRPRLRGVEQHDVGCTGRGRGQRAVTGGKALDDEPDALADPAHLRRRLTAVELGTDQTDAAHDFDHALPAFVSEHTDGRGTGRQSTHDGTYVVRRHLAGAPRSEHEAERVGTERNRQQRILFVRDATDLHEHKHDGTGRMPANLTITLVPHMGPAAQEITEPRPAPGVSNAVDWVARRRAPVVGVYVVASVTAGAVLGWPERPFLVIWLIGALLLACVRSQHPVARIVIDWLPVLVIAAGYDLVRSFASDLVPRAVVEPQLRFDEIVFGGTAPTVVLQRWLDPAHGLHAWDYLVFCFYLSHFVVAPCFALYLYLRDRERFHRLAMVILGVSLAGFVTYFIVPAVPPWKASELGDLQHTVRVVQRVWADLGASGPAKAFAGKDTQLANPVAALPSLHAAWPFLVLMFTWRRAPRGRWVALGYNAAMVFVLVYGAEHYVSDILLGWLYAVIAFVLVNRFVDRRVTAARAR
jgi:hypothetical protein